MEGQTLKWVRRELIYHYLHRVQREWRNEEISFMMKLSFALRMVQAVLWNAVHMGNTLRLKKEVEKTRKLTDQQLMRRGVLCSSLGEPYITRDIRAAEARGPRAARRKGLSGKVVMSSSDNNSLGSGWHEREQDSRGSFFRWTEDRAVLYLKGKEGKRDLVLHTVMAHPAGNTRASVTLNGRFLSVIEVPNQPHSQRIGLPPDLQPGDWEVVFEVENPFSPLEMLGVEDHRRLGFAVSRVETD